MPKKSKKKFNWKIIQSSFDIMAIQESITASFSILVSLISEPLINSNASELVGRYFNTKELP